ncbi:MAG: SPOR domain-containing protein [Saprospiraceae bacterium]
MVDIAVLALQNENFPDLIPYRPYLCNMQLIKTLLSICLVLCLTSSRSAAQNITVYETPNVRAMLERFVQVNQTHMKLKGYRVQLIFTNDRRVMESEKRKFEHKYEGQKTVWSFNDPYFQLRTGAFANRVEADQFLSTLKHEYPSAFVIEDEIQVVELVQ